MPQTRPIPQTLRHYGRSLAGGLLFSVASLYTMELWWDGYTASPAAMLLTFLAALVLLTAYAYYAGLEAGETLGENVVEAFETLALGTLATLVVLKLAGQLPPGFALDDLVRRAFKPAVIASIGVAVGTTQLGPDDDDEQAADESSEAKSQRSVGHRLSLSALGAVLIGSSVASTEEILMIATEAPTWAVLGLSVLSMALVLGIVRYTDFRGASRETSFAGGAWGDAAATYGVALLVALAMLASGGHLGGLGAASALDLSVVLALPCSLGAAAGRLLL